MEKGICPTCNSKTKKVHLSYVRPLHESYVCKNCGLGVSFKQETTKQKTDNGED